MRYKFPYKAHFQRSTGVYCALVALLSLGYVFLVQAKSSLKKYQKFNVFVTSMKVDIEPFRNKISEYVDESVVEQVVINSVNPSLTSYYTMYSTFGLEDADVLILEKNAIYQNDLKSHFLSFSSDSSFYGLASYAYDDTHYGLDAYKQKKGYFSDFITFEEEGEYYLFVNAKSEHLKGLQESGRSSSVLSFLEGFYHGEA